MGRRNAVGTALQSLGQWTMMAGGVVLVGIFVVVLLNGRWPHFLFPVRNYYQLVTSLLGDLGIIVEIWTFLGPGGLIYLLGKRIADPSSR
jgi:hypothetical protein